MAAVDPKITVNQPPVQEDSGPAIPEPVPKAPHHHPPQQKKPQQPQEKLAPGLEKLKRPYINTDEVLRIGSVLERRMKMTEQQRQSFEWLAYTRVQDMQRMPDFFVHLQRAIGGVVLSPRLADEAVEYLLGRRLLTTTERDAIVQKMLMMPPNNLTMSAIGELLRTESQVFRGAASNLD